MMKRATKLLFPLIWVIFYIFNCSSGALADIVVPSDRVKKWVAIREHSTSQSTKIGVLRRGEHLNYLGSVTGWHKVELNNGQTGFLPKSWTDVLPDPVNPSANSPFTIHFLDVGTGDSAIIDMGEREIIIDGGDSVKVLSSYVDQTGVIDGPIELVIVTHGDQDHWKGLSRLLGFDGVRDNSPSVLEYWDAGYNRDCNPPESGGRKNYLKFTQDMKGNIPSSGFHRPLENFHIPADVSGQPQSFTISSLPGVTFTLLHSNSSPTTGSCSYKINNASIVLMIEIDGVRFLFTGDANGKARNESSPGTPSHVEKKLLNIEANHPGTLKADVLKVPHHGSETASTQQFIDAVNPDFAIISASTKHHLPKETVIQRYQNGQRIILQTDANRENNRDHIICTKSGNEIDCNFADVLNE